MANRNKYLVLEVIKTITGEKLLLEYVREPGDPNFDDLPSEQLKPGETIYPEWNKEKQKEDEFNKAKK